MKKKTVTYKNRKGRTVKVTIRQYLALAARVDQPCVEGHYGCAAVEGGPCGAELEAELEGGS